MNDQILDALTVLELRDAALLSWGATGGRWTSEELRDVLSDVGDPDSLVPALLEGALLVAGPDGSFRTRSAETVRLLAALRQAFPNQPVTAGASLVLDYRYIHRARRRPRRDQPAAVLLAVVKEMAGDATAAHVAPLVPSTVSGFQLRSTDAILRSLRSNGGSGVIVTAGTGSGKTLAFYLPLLAHLAEQPACGTSALALYPRNELLKDQLRALLLLTRQLAAGPAPGRRLSAATWFGDTPLSAYAVQQGWASAWKEKGNGYVCPYLRCLRCNKDLLWLKADVAAKPAVERLTCSASDCGDTIDGAFLRLTRDTARRKPADIMLSSTESLNRQLSTPANLAAFGVSPGTLRTVLLDEVHVYEGLSGAQNALLLRRLRHAVGKPLTYVALSATLRNAAEFFSRFVNVPVTNVTLVQPDPEELEEAGAEYLLALRHDPNSNTGVLSTSIQTCMALARCLDGEDDPFSPPPSSEQVFGRRLFVFADKLDSTNRLYWDLLNAEGQAWPGKNLSRSPLTLAHARSEHQERLAVGRRETAARRDEDGQWWWLAEHLGHRLDGDLPLRISRTSSQDRGVSSASQVVVATASLEVGFDDERVGAVVQHKAPHDNAQFLQRKGRAGRLQKTRPWTVVVLGDWGADRRAWDSYDELFDPELPPRNLPLDNRYVLRIQAVYATLDWLSTQVVGSESWADLAGPADLLHARNPARANAARERQRQLEELLGRLLRPGVERDLLRRHLRLALALGSEEAAGGVLDSILWDAPRPLLLAVVPTIRRRLRDQWRGERPAADDEALRTRTPLREFVPGNLFDELLVPDVEFIVPSRPGQTSVEYLPALRALREFAPGNVSRHFGVWATNKRHWLPLPPEGADGIGRVDVTEAFDAVPIDSVVQDDKQYPVYSPRRVRLEAVPDTVRDASSMRLDWTFSFSALSDGWKAPLAGRVRRLFADMSCHLHADAGGGRVLRSARTASGTLWDPGARRLDLEFGVEEGGSWTPVVLGVDVACDALVAQVVLPEPPQEIPARERSARLLHLLRDVEELPEDINTFDRSSLADVVLLARVLGLQGRPGEGVERYALSRELEGAAELLGLFDPDDPEANEWADWLSDDDVIRSVVRCVEEVEASSRSVSWSDWWRRRYTLTAAHVGVAALSSLSPGVDPEGLMIDLLQERDDTFVVSEQSPGGVGHVEAFRRVLNEDPSLFTRAVADAMRPTELELLDHELTALIDLDEEEVAEALASLRMAWIKGHAAATAAVRGIDSALSRTGRALSASARKVLATRLAGPGAHADLLEHVSAWLVLREKVAATGYEVDSRLLGAIVGRDPAPDAALQLPADVTSARRARAVANVLWPWGYAADPDGGGNLYSDRVGMQLPELRRAANLDPARVVLQSWSGQEREQVHRILVEDGEATLAAAHADRAVLREAMLDLQIEPVEVGAILAHPVTVGVWEEVDTVIAHLLLREAS